MEAKALSPGDIVRLKKFGSVPTMLYPHDGQLSRAGDVCLIIECRMSLWSMVEWCIVYNARVDGLRSHYMNDLETLDENG